jgi:hypothetical protein
VATVGLYALRVMAEAKAAVLTLEAGKTFNFDDP